jgi:hypothetical protein
MLDGWPLPTQKLMPAPKRQRKLRVFRRDEGRQSRGVLVGGGGTQVGGGDTHRTIPTLAAPAWVKAPGQRMSKAAGKRIILRGVCLTRCLPLRSIRAVTHTPPPRFCHRPLVRTLESPANMIRTKSNEWFAKQLIRRLTALTKRQARRFSKRLNANGRTRRMPITMPVILDQGSRRRNAKPGPTKMTSRTSCSGHRNAKKTPDGSIRGSNVSKPVKS